jgi:ketosteroid isomerase-like protein
VAGSDPLATFHALFRSVLDERDPDAFMALWAEEDDVAMWGSELTERADGRAELRTLGESIAAHPGEIRFTWDDLHVHKHGDIAWINAAGSVNGSPYRMTAVLVRRAGEWRWHTFSGSEPRV